MTIEVELNTEQESTKEQEATEHQELEQTSVMDEPVVQPVQNQKRKLIAVGLSYLIRSRKPRKGNDTSSKKRKLREQEPLATNKAKGTQ